MDDTENYTSGTPEPENQHIPRYEQPDDTSYTDYQNFTYSYDPEPPPNIRKRKNTGSEKFIIFLFVLIILLAVGLSVYGIASDISNSQKVIDEIKKQNHVVMYQQTKPAGANELSNFIDENGKYTIEGASASVRNSIVEIYTYTDKTQKQLSGTGSGVVISDDGYIVTNAHVLNADGFHTVHTTDDNVYNAKIIGRDSKTDIAIIKVDNAKLEPAVLGNSDEAIVGEQVIAVGNPAGLSNTVTDGIISAVNRKIRSDSTGFEMNCIQTNADISPGNSGGALVNMYGQVIGITSSKYVSSSFEGLGFAITINDALPIIEELIDNGFVGGRFRIGIQLVDMETAEKVLMIETELGFTLPDGFEGVYISSISEDCDIANTDLKAGDFITEIDGTPIRTYDELYNNISSKYGAGDKVPAKCANVQKDGKVTYYDIEFMLMEDTSGDY